MRHRGPKLSLVAEGLAFQMITSLDHYVHYVRYSYSMFVHLFIALSRLVGSLEMSITVII